MFRPANQERPYEVEITRDPPRDIVAVIFRMRLEDGTKRGFQIRFTQEVFESYFRAVGPGQRYPAIDLEALAKDPTKKQQEKY